ncbi:MAG: hypothetical protein NTX88_04145 [Candidatus Atribacteria bacterium]|nr:hypothetical protein [Candidatus Atribacteria bacterium]
MPLKSFHAFFFIVLVGVIFLAVSFPSFSRDIQFIPIQEIKRGMNGYGKTVFYGTRIENFEVEVIDVVIGKDISRSYIVVKVTDDRLRQLGGISAGMSGSPVYFADKIAGALAYSWETKDNLIGVVTPIEAMFQLWDDPKKAALPPQAHPQSLLYAFGMGERGGERLRQKEQVHFKKVITLPKVFFGGATEPQEGELEPGSAVGVQLIHGDVDVVSLGTLTLRDGSDILAFGHPFLHRGKVSYYLSSMYVNFSLEGKDFPFKVGTPIQPVGIVEEDRGVGITGRLGVMPQVISTHIQINDESKSVTDYHFDIVQDENVVVEFLPEIILDSIDQSLDRQVPGSVRVRLIVEGPRFHFDEDFFWMSKLDVASFTSNSLGNILEDIFKNPFSSIDAKKIDITVFFLSAIREATFKSLHLPVDVKRGGNLKGKVEFNMFREDTKTLDFSITVPANFVSGEADVIARGLSSNQDVSSSPSTSPTDFNSYLQEKVKQLKTNGMVIEVRSKAETSPNENPKTFFSQSISLPFVLDGSFTGSVVIRE